MLAYLVHVSVKKFLHLSFSPNTTPNYVVVVEPDMGVRKGAGGP